VLLRRRCSVDVREARLRPRPEDRQAPLGRDEGRRAGLVEDADRTALRRRSGAGTAGSESRLCAPALRTRIQRIGSAESGRLRASRAGCRTSRSRGSPSQYSL
jgi:hypothetical protein